MDIDLSPLPMILLPKPNGLPRLLYSPSGCSTQHYLSTGNSFYSKWSVEMGLCSWKLLSLSCCPPPWSSQPDTMMDWPFGVLVTAPNGWLHLAEWGQCPGAWYRYPKSISSDPPAFTTQIHGSKYQTWLFLTYFDTSNFAILFILFIDKILTVLSKKQSKFLSVITVKWDLWQGANTPTIHGGRGSSETGSQHSAIVRILFYLSPVKEVPCSWKTVDNLSSLKKNDSWNQECAKSLCLWYSGIGDFVNSREVHTVNVIDTGGSHH